ncbi:hypothetical protein [Thalassotalea atypica]|uniref:hypothetical protein n=1 Tax=Thalassotalea atypica TaxID=2054316 RepID=UPI0025740DEC|nr:hypothetical protein [Thalassotalea atypica]
MNKKSGLSKVVALTTLLCSSAYATPNTIDIDGLKVAIIKDAVGTNEVLTGNYPLAERKLTTSSKLTTSQFDQSMGLCVTYLKMTKLNKANNACSKALSSILGKSGRAKYLASMAYSNRAVVKYLAKDHYGALDDMSSAILTSRNKVVKDNLLILKQNISELLNTSNTEPAFVETE